MGLRRIDGIARSCGRKTRAASARRTARRGVAVGMALVFVVAAVPYATDSRAAERVVDWG